MDKIEIDIKALLDSMTKDQLRELVEECNKRIYKQNTKEFYPWAYPKQPFIPQYPQITYCSDSKVWPKEFQDAFDKDKQVRKIIGGNA